MIAPEIKKILVTTDLSEDATSAYPYAISLANTYKCSLIVLSCIDTSLQYTPSGVGTLEIPAMYTSEKMDDLKSTFRQELSQHIKEHFKDVSVTHEVCEAPIGGQNTIANYIAANKIDLVIMSSHGRSGIARALLGSVTEHVLRHCEKPVLVVPAR